jgi:hypothetical protein
MISRWAVVIAGVVLAPLAARAQTFPVTPGTIEVQAGMAGVVLPEASDGTYSAQPEFRVGYFLAPALQLQLVVHSRLWPLGAVAARNHGVVAHAVWFPNLGPQNRNLYLMAGAGGARNVPPPATGLDVSFDPLLRGGVGYKIPLQDVGLGFLSSTHLTVEYRAEYWLQDEAAFVSGAAFGFSYFL